MRPLSQRLSMWPSAEMLNDEISDDRRIPPYFNEGMIEMK